MARNSPSALIMSRIRSSCESPTMCWAFCYRENLCGVSESKELFYDLVIIKGTRLVSEQPSLFLPFFGLLWTKVCAWLFWSHPLLPGATGRHPKRALNFLPLWRQLCIHHFTSSISVQQLSLKQAGECSKGLLWHIQLLVAVSIMEGRGRSCQFVAITQPILFSVKGNLSKLLPLQSSEVHLKFGIDLTLF